jgi:predicted secreted protein
MGPVSALVLYLVIWFMVLFVVLPLRLETQGERGEVEPGTPESAPANLDMWKKARLVTWVAAIIWALIAAVILSEIVTVRDLDWFGRMG